MFLFIRMFSFNGKREGKLVTFIMFFFFHYVQMFLMCVLVCIKPDIEQWFLNMCIFSCFKLLKTSKLKASVLLKLFFLK